MDGVRSRLLAVVSVLVCALSLTACAPSADNFSALGNAICANTGRSLASQGAQAISEETSEEQLADLYLAILTVHLQERKALGGLTAPGDKAAAWQAFLTHLDAVNLYAKNQLTGRKQGSSIDLAHQDQSHAAFAAFGLSECATRGQEWPGYGDPVGPGSDSADPPPGTPVPDGTPLPFGVEIEGFETAPDPNAVPGEEPAAPPAAP